ncbi:hypothetical protein PQO03_05495 [Lentisphaera profundi]|uniref:Uncharacterized protein n=1 Tax=Lentisphaera profundi TaxID=1658616 RepID=A0ABY7VVT9_9BACT|nr:hypothetical protein [Lentisphaera profundi]WDE97403.1 hypothetical protein PQO03_05495 [Lentisphaera profundi]
MNRKRRFNLIKRLVVIIVMQFDEIQEIKQVAEGSLLIGKWKVDANLDLRKKAGLKIKNPQQNLYFDSDNNRESSELKNGNNSNIIEDFERVPRILK